MVAYSLGNKGTNCNVVKGVFGTPASSVASTDIILGVFANACGFATPIQLARAIMAIGITDTQFLNNFCIASTICANTTSCPLILSFLYNISGTNLNITKLAFDTIPTSAQTVTVLYRVSGHSPAYPYTTYSTAITVGSNGYLVTPVSIPVTVGVTYDIQVLQNCSSPASGVEQTITVTSASVATSVIKGTDSSTVCSIGVPTTVYTSGSLIIGSVLYSDSGLTTPISGNYFVVVVDNIYSVVGGIVTASVGSCASVIAFADATFTQTVTAITGLSPFALSGSLTAGNTQTGSHNAIVSGVISAAITGASASNSMDLKINGVDVQTVFIMGAGTYSFSAISALATDIIEVSFYNNA